MRSAWAYVWLVVALLLTGFWAYGLFDLDEGIYAAALTEMLHKGEWITITFQGNPFFEKPILIYWFALAFTKIGVPGVVALRLASVLAAIGTLAWVAAFCRKHFSDAVAIGATLLLGTSVMFMALARMFTPDSLLVFAMTGAYLSYWDSLEGDKRWRILTGFLLGVAVLAKGPMPVAVFVVLAIYCIKFRRERATLLTSVKGWFIPIFIFLLTVSTWYVPVLLQSGAAVFNELIIKQNFGRLGGGDTAHLGPPYYFVPIVLLCFIPASVVIPWAWRKARSQPVEKFLWAWALTIFILFSASGTKLPHYILPLLPPLAILLSKSLLSAPRAYQTAMIVFSVLVAAGFGYVATLRDESVQGLGLPLAIAAIVGLAAGIVVFVRYRAPLIQALAMAFPVCSAALLIVVPAYWRRAYADVSYMGSTIAAVQGDVIEYRTGAERKRGDTAHPSIIWISGKLTRQANTPRRLVEMVQPGDSVLTRERRLDEARPALAERGFNLVEVEAKGRFQIFRVDAIPKK